MNDARPDEAATPPDDRARERPAPGGPYFGRLLVVLFVAVAFCAFMTWLLSTLMGS